MYNPYTLEKKILLITGASSGIGRQIAIECSKMGAKLILTARNEKKLLETKSMLSGDNHIIISADLTDEEQLTVLVEKLNSIDGIVHSAGVEEPIPIQFVNNEIMNYTFSVNANAPILLMAKLIKAKKISKSASVVFISSISGQFCSMIGGALYSASKNALNGFAKAAALELAPKGIRVNCINPGMIETDLSLGIVSKEQFETDKQKYPLKRYGTSRDIAFATIFLLSDASSWITGINMVVDGGFLLN